MNIKNISILGFALIIKFNNTILNQKLPIKPIKEPIKPIKEPIKPIKEPIKQLKNRFGQLKNRLKNELIINKIICSKIRLY